MKKILLPLLAFVGAVSAAASTRDSDVVGTYQLLICKSDCSFQNTGAAVARGTIVLFLDPLRDKDVDKLDPYLPLSVGAPPRACFHGVQSKHSGTYAFIQKTGVTAWSFKNGKLEFSLYHSPDAGYGVTLRLRGDILSGKGQSWGGGVGGSEFTRVDVVIARRVGAPNISACSPAA